MCVFFSRSSSSCKNRYIDCDRGIFTVFHFSGMALGCVFFSRAACKWKSLKRLKKKKFRKLTCYPRQSIENSIRSLRDLYSVSQWRTFIVRMERSGPHHIGDKWKRAIFNRTEEILCSSVFRPSWLWNEKQRCLQLGRFFSLFFPSVAISFTWIVVWVCNGQTTCRFSQLFCCAHDEL